MGAWGTGILDNDEALDGLAHLEAAGDLSGWKRTIVEPRDKLRWE